MTPEETCKSLLAEMASADPLEEHVRRIQREEHVRRIQREMGIVHKDDVPWHDAELPPWDHQCRVQTSGPIRGGLIERCPCGAVRFDGYGVWIEINSTRKHRGETEPVAAKVSRPLRSLPWQVWMIVALIVGFSVGFLALWLSGWGPRIGGTWALVLTQATAWGLAIPVALWRANRQYH